MTIEELSKLSDEELNVRLAEKVFGGSWYTNPEGVSYLRFDEDRSKDRLREQLPRYCSDLNAVAEVEKECFDNLMDADQWELYGKNLERVHPTAVAHTNGEVDYWEIASIATVGPRQRTIALILCLTK